MTPAQALLASVRGPPPPPLPAPPPPPPPPEALIALAKASLAPDFPPSAWLRSPATASAPPAYLAPSSVHFPGVCRYDDAHARVPFSEGLYAPDGADLPRAPVVWTLLAAAWPALRGWDAPSLAARCAPGDTFALDGGPGFAREGLHSASVSMAASGNR